MSMNGLDGLIADGARSQAVPRIERGQVMTVAGPVRADRLGLALMHEHLICDYYAINNNYDDILDEEDLIVEELGAFNKASGRTLVELTNIGGYRNPQALKRISKATGVNVVMGCGWYMEKVYPKYIYEKSVGQLADMVVSEFTEGVDGTGIRPGIIGEIGTERHYISPAEERVFRACVRAQHETGLAISTHTTRCGDLAAEQIALLSQEGANMQRVIIGHMGDQRDIDNIMPILDAGAYTEIDHIGYTAFQHDEQRARNVAELIRRGYLKQILLSTDLCAASQLHWFDGKGYDYLIKVFIPMLKDVGVSQADIDTMLTTNPQRVLTVES